MTPRQRLLAAIAGDPSLVERLLVVAEGPPIETIRGPDDCYRLFAPLLEGLAVEHFAVAALDRRNRVIAVETLTTGCDAFCIVDPKQIFRWALLQGRSGATGILLAHNHPSGDPTPSAQDHEVTRRVRRAGEIVGIKLLDHIVIGGGTYDRVD